MKEERGAFITYRDEVKELVNELKSRGMVIGPSLSLICKEFCSKYKSDGGFNPSQAADEVVKLFKSHTN